MDAKAKENPLVVTLGPKQGHGSNKLCHIIDNKKNNKVPKLFVDWDFEAWHTVSFISMDAIQFFSHWRKQPTLLFPFGCNSSIIGLGPLNGTVAFSTKGGSP